MTGVNRTFLMLDSFGFGLTNLTNSSEYYESLLNDYSSDGEYAEWRNTSTVALDFRGIGLPSDVFEDYTYYLAVITSGQATCSKR